MGRVEAPLSSSTGAATPRRSGSSAHDDNLDGAGQLQQSAGHSAAWLAESSFLEAHGHHNHQR